KVVVESPKVRSFYLEYRGGGSPEPGQFMMVWLPGSEEVPMSISGWDGSTIRISVAKEGKTTARFHKLKKGDAFFMRGPFGNPFSLEGGAHLLVGGGYGTAPLICACNLISKMGKRGTYLAGAESASELLFLKEARILGMKVHVTTEDGSVGHRGVVTDLLEQILSKEHFDSILTCGPERMMYEVVQRGVGRGIRVQASLERYMKCGFGICGSCVLDPLGLRVCVDGPVFDGALLLRTEFGKRRRNASGSKVTI
ncbi:MAG TPA: dihydroorotate dehydrogenase electron transfer subunit, partial [Hadesarchaea archaeon]|nr:dihydroorotate dehydrogenase electron transfer subunit [Hadesarchaea archaeon]